MALIAAQMYTLREVCKTPAQIAVACAKVKKMGYDVHVIMHDEFKCCIQ